MSDPVALHAEAVAAAAAGLSVLAIRADGTKRPDGPWKAAQTTPAAVEVIDALFTPNGTARGLGVVSA